MLRILIISLAFFAASVSASPFSEEFLAAGRQIPSELHSYRSFGTLNLAEFMSRMDEVTVVTSSIKFVAKSNGNGRITGFFDATPGALKISVFKPSWDRWPDAQSLFALHEYLRIFGFADYKYRMSIRMWFLSLPKTQALLSAVEKSSIIQELSRLAKIKFAGGVIGVGRGGEISTLHFRAEDLLAALNAMENGSLGEAEVWHRALPGVLDTQTTVTYPAYDKTPIRRSPKANPLPPQCLTRFTSCTKFKVAPATCYCDGDLSAPGTVIYPY